MNKVREPTPTWQGADEQGFVISIDQHASMGARSGHEVAGWSDQFLEHNRIVYQQVCEWNGRAGVPSVDLVAFVGDGAILTARGADDAVRFSLETVSSLARAGIQTGVGIAFGQVSQKVLVDGSGTESVFRQVVGRPVDLAVRLSWMAMPAQLLITKNAAAWLSQPTDHFRTHPEQPVYVSYDKWVPAEAYIRTAGESIEWSAPLPQLDLIFGGTSMEPVFSIVSSSDPVQSNTVPMNRRRLWIMISPLPEAIIYAQKRIQEIRGEITGSGFDGNGYDYQSRKVTELVSSLSWLRDRLTLVPAEITSLPGSGSLFGDWMDVGSTCDKLILELEDMHAKASMSLSKIDQCSDQSGIIQKTNRLATKLTRVRSTLAADGDG